MQESFEHPLVLRPINIWSRGTSVEERTDYPVHHAEAEQLPFGPETGARPKATSMVVKQQKQIKAYEDVAKSKNFFIKVEEFKLTYFLIFRFIDAKYSLKNEDSRYTGLYTQFILFRCNEAFRRNKKTKSSDGVNKFFFLNYTFLVFRVECNGNKNH